LHRGTSSAVPRRRPSCGGRGAPLGATSGRGPTACASCGGYVSMSPTMSNRACTWVARRRPPA
jgi:hypothetical protein